MVTGSAKTQVPATQQVQNLAAHATTGHVESDYRTITLGFSLKDPFTL